MISEPRHRDIALRRALVATVEAPPLRPRWRLAALSVAAFAVAGALTGGALAVTVAPRAVESIEPSAVMPPSFLETDAVVVGKPWALATSHGAVVELGTAPEGANHLAVVLRCADPGEYRLHIEGRFDAGIGCTKGDTSGGVGFVYPVEQVPRAFEIVATAASGRLEIALAWVTRVPDPEPSAEVVAAIADGVVDEDEYRAGFDRYSACLEQAGYRVGINRTGPVIDYVVSGDAMGSSGERVCYLREFADVDGAWQIAQEG